MADEVKVGVVIKRLEVAGRFLVATRGSHRPFKHPIRPGRVTVAAKHSDELAPGNGFSVYVPDLPGCVAAAFSREAVLVEIRAAIQFHLDGLAIVSV